MSRTPHVFPRMRVRMLAVVVLALLAGHGLVLYYLSSNLVLPAAVLSGAIIVLGIKHVGLLGPLYALWRRRRLRQRLK
jgi:hypothetical protein